MQAPTNLSGATAVQAQPKRSKRMFTAEEDQKLRELVETHGDHSWKIVASKVPGRTSRQCRERWRNYLSPLVKPLEWTPDEDKKLEELTELYSRNWSRIAKMFPFRTNTSVKNRWVKLQRHKRLTKTCDVVVPDKDTSCPIEFWEDEPCGDLFGLNL